MGEVLVPYGDDAQQVALALLAAAEKLGVEVFLVRNQPEDNGFRVPPEVADEAGLTPVDEEREAAESEAARREVNERISAGENVTPADSPPAKKPPRKRAPRKRTAKKSATPAASKE